MIKDRKKPYVYVHEGYFVEKIDFFQKYILFSTGEFLNVRKFLKNTEFCVKTPSLERGIFECTEVFEKHGILC